MKKNTLISVALLFLAAVVLPSTPATAKPVEICVQLKWYHQAQFAGFYMAREEGYYRAEGLKVNLIESGPGVDWQKIMKADLCPLGIINAYEIIIARQRGTPVKAVAAMDQVSPIVWFSLKGSGITNPRQFKGKKVVMVPTGRLHLIGMMTKVGLSLSDMEILPFSLDMAPLYRGDVDVWSGYSTNLVTKAEEDGHSVAVIHPFDYGVQIYDDVLYVEEAFAQRNPEAVTGFLRATFKGWMEAFKRQDDAIEYTLRYAKGGVREHEKKLLSRTLPYVHTGEVPIGWMEGPVWEDISRLAFEAGLTQRMIPVGEVFDDSFLKRAHGLDGK